MFHLDISGKDFKDEHLPKTKEISFILFIFHLDKSGKDSNEVQL